MANTIFIKNRSVCNKLLKQYYKPYKIEATKTAKDCISFAGVSNYLHIFCPNLQMFLKPIYGLARRGRLVLWTNMQQKVFE